VELDGSLADPQLGVRYPHLEPLAAAMVDEDLEILHFRTKASQYEVAIVARMCLTNTGTEGRRWRVRGVIGTRLLFRRFVAVYSSRDGPAPLESARAHLRALRWSDFEPQVAAHEAGWGQLWGSADVRIDGQPAVEQVLHFNAYHLRCAVDHDPRVSIGARTLSGRGYGGHVFWDVEMFMMPFYLHTCPELARELLRYRHRTLAGARERSRAQGYRGACYAWESTVTGADVTPHFVRLASSGRKIPVYTGTQQLHITADIAHAIWRYWEATGDAAFLADCGVEVLIETARFWSSRCTPENGSYHIRGVMGPDEYHCNVSDNAYTNYLVRCNLENADRGVRWLRTEMPRRARELEGELGLTPAEPASWLQIARELYCPAPRSDGVIEQFAGFFNLDPYPPPGVDRDAAPVNRLLDAERIDRMQLLKQADVLMLLHLFPEKFSRQTMLANYHYYEPRTDHASSLSPPIHAAIAARLGLHADAERYLQRSLWLDLSDEMSGSASGVHAAGMGGTWQALVFGFLGVRFGQMGVEVDPDAASRLPRGWTSVELELAWRGQRYPVQVRR